MTHACLRKGIWPASRRTSHQSWWGNAGFLCPWSPQWCWRHAAHLFRALSQPPHESRGEPASGSCPVLSWRPRSPHPCGSFPNPPSCHPEATGASKCFCGAHCVQRRGHIHDIESETLTTKDESKSTTWQIISLKRKHDIHNETRSVGTMKKFCLFLAFSPFFWSQELRNGYPASKIGTELGKIVFLADWNKSLHGEGDDVELGIGLVLNGI